MENLEQRLKYFIKNEDSEDAKKLTKVFYEPISVVGGRTTWTKGKFRKSDQVFSTERVTTSSHFKLCDSRNN